MIELENKVNDLIELYHRGPLGAEIIIDEEEHFFPTTNKYHFCYYSLDYLKGKKKHL